MLRGVIVLRRLHVGPRFARQEGVKKITKRVGELMAVLPLASFACSGGAQHPSPAASDVVCVDPPEVNGSFKAVWTLALGNGVPARAVLGPKGDIFAGGYFVGDLQIGGHTFAAPDPDAGFLLRLNQDRGLVWERTLATDLPSDIGVDTAGNLYYLSDAAEGLVLAKLDASGNEIWKKTFSVSASGIQGADFFGAPQMAVDGAGNVALTGVARDAIDFGGGSSPGPNYSVFVAVFDTTGNYRWSRAFEGGIGPSVAFDRAGNLVMVGGFTGVMDLGGGMRLGSAAHASGFAAKFDSTGTPLWAKGLGAGALVSAVAAGTDGTILAGSFNGALVLDGAAAQAESNADLFLGSVADIPGTMANLTTWAASSGRISSLVSTPGGGTTALVNVGDFVDLGFGVVRPPGIALVKSDGQGQAVGAAVFHAPYGVAGQSLGYDSAGNLVVFGSFEGAIDLGAGELTGTRSFVGTMFLAKYAPQVPSGVGRAGCGQTAHGDVIAASPDPGLPNLMAIGGDSLFFATGTAVLKRPLAGGEASVIAFGQRDVADLRLDDHSVYWATAASTEYEFVPAPAHSGAILSASRTGGAPPVVLAEHQDQPTAIAIDSGTIYWTTVGIPATSVGAPSASGQLLSVPSGGGVPRVLASALFRPGPLAVGGGYVVLAALTTGASDGGSQIVRVSPAGELAVLATTQRLVTSMAVADGIVYWADGDSPTVDSSIDDGRMQSVPLAGGFATILLERQAGPAGILPIGEDLYWYNSGGKSNFGPHNNGAILRIPRTGGPVTTVVGGLESVRAFTANQSALAYVRTDYPSWSLVVGAQ
jgi:hypothetical protein